MEPLSPVGGKPRFPPRYAARANKLLELPAPIRHPRSHSLVMILRKQNAGVLGCGWAATARLAAINAGSRTRVTDVRPNFNRTPTP
jgi:hypothetical protein